MLICEADLLKIEIADQQREVVALEKKAAEKAAAHEALPMATQDYLTALEAQKERNAGVKAAVQSVRAATKSFKERNAHALTQDEKKCISDFHLDILFLSHTTRSQNSYLAQLIELLKMVVPGS